MKLIRWGAVAVAVVFFAGALSGCGVSQKKYDALMNEKAVFEERCALLLRAKEALTSEYDNLLKEKMDLATRLETAANEKKALKDEYDKLLEEKITLKAVYDKLLAESKGLQDQLTESSKK